MIVRAIESELWLFSQRDHSELCGRMAAAWGRPPWEPVPEAVRRAAAVHDAGWPEWDRRPRLDPETGWPHPYSKMPAEDYRSIWRRGLGRGWAEGEDTGLLVSLHAMRFFERKTEPADRRLLEAQRSRQARALEALGARAARGGLPEPYATWHAWMFFWDGLSLFLCEHWDSPWRYRLPRSDGQELEVRVERAGPVGAAGAEVTIDPFPFTAPLRLEAPARVVPARRYERQAELDAAVAAASGSSAGWMLRPRE